ncbi:lamin tail domain-containing protein [Candidatus Sumerlaeota bacterium]
MGSFDFLADRWCWWHGGLGGLRQFLLATAIVILCGATEPLAADVLISEFMAINDTVLQDEDGDYPDWLELVNVSPAPVNLDGWYLTDDSADLTKWRFPAQSIDPGEYLIVFASDKDRAVAGSELHTNFKLSAAGEYLALVEPDGSTTAHEYAPMFVEQLPDVSFGFKFDRTSLTDRGTAAEILIPYPGALDPTWIEDSYSTGPSWFGGPLGVGFNVNVVERAGQLLVDLRADDLPLGPTSSWPNRGSLGGAFNLELTSTGGYQPLAQENDFGDGPARYLTTAESILLELQDGGGTTIEAPAELIEGSDYSIEAWVMMTPGQEGGENCFFGWGRRPERVAQFDFGNSYGSGAFVSWHDGDYGWVRDAADGLPPAGEFHHLVYTHTGSEIAVYVDGELAIGPGAKSNPVPVGDPITCFNIYNDVGLHDGFIGSIAQVRVHDRVLTLEQLQHNFVLDAERFGRTPAAGMQLLNDLIETDIESQMLGSNASACVRVPFELGPTAEFEMMQLEMRYADGFVAYLNGVEVARRNAPASPAWNSSATAKRTAEEAAVVETLNLGQHLGLLQQGSNVLALHLLNVDVNDDELLLLPELIVSSATTDTLGYFATPTAGSINSASFQHFVADTKFSPDRGFYDAPLAVTISTTGTVGTTIRYTLDGSEPTAVSGTVYTAPIPISETTTLRAAAFKDGYEPTNVDTHTYILISDVLTQSPNGELPSPDWPANDQINGQDLNYGMDPDVVNDPRYVDQMTSAMLAVPSISLVTDLANLFDPATGIYVNAFGRGPAWERPVSVELLNPDATSGFQIDAGMRIRGASSRDPNNPKHAFRLFFRGEYGDTKLRYPLFGDEGADRFDNVDLRCEQNYSWSYARDGNSNAMVREVFSRDLQRESGQPYTRSRYYHLYLNGHYWGIYQTQERAEASYAETYFGGVDTDYDVVKNDHNWPRQIEATDGDLAAYTRLFDATVIGYATDEAYFRIQGMNTDGTRNVAYERLVDVDNVIDCMLTVFISGDKDAPITAFSGNAWANNYYGIYNRANPDGFKFFRHDAEHSLDRGEADRTGPYLHPNFDLSVTYFNPQTLHQKLAENDNYRLRLADHVQKHFFNDGAMTPAKLSSLMLSRAAELDLAILGESARWGDSRANPPKTKDDDWLPLINVINNLLLNRTAIVLAQLHNRGWLPAVDAPVLSQHGGLIPEDFTLSIANPNGSGTIYYVLGSSEFRLVSGAPLPNALLYTGPIALSDSVRVRAAVLAGGEWSAATEADFLFGIPAGPENLALTELHYNPLPPTAAELAINPAFVASDFEFIELMNNSSSAMLVSNVSFTNGITAIVGATPFSLEAGERMLVVGNQLAFEARYGAGLNIVGDDFTGNLNDGGERIELVDASSSPIFSFTYNDARGWPVAADGAGHSLVPLAAAVAAEPDDSLDYGGNWRASSFIGGSPGVADPAPAPPLLLNEITAHTDFSDPAFPDHDSNDWIELYSGASSAMVLDEHWYLSDSADDLRKWNVPAGTSIAGGWGAFDETHDFHQPIASGFGLNKAGERLFLSYLPGTAADRVVDSVRFKGQELGVSLGRAPNGGGYWFALAPTREAPNGSPLGDLVIEEFAFHALDDPAHEYIKLTNRTAAAIELWTAAGEWRLTGGIDYVFPAGTIVPPGGGLLVVSFDPADAVALAAFEAAYAVDLSGTSLLGPYGGTLSNKGERLALERPQGSDDPQLPLDVNWVIVDEVIYFYRAPWTTGADGTGLALRRVSLAGSGNDPANWIAAAAEPAVVGEYLLSVTAVGGTVARVPDQASYLPGTPVSLTAQADPGYQFVNWTGDLPGGISAANPLQLTMDSPKTIAANFAPLPPSDPLTTSAPWYLY